MSKPNVSVIATVLEQMTTETFEVDGCTTLPPEQWRVVVPDAMWARWQRQLADANVGWLAGYVATLERKLAEREDWPDGAVYDAVMRVREASEHDGEMTQVSPSDLRMLFASADGVAHSYSTVLSHICGLSKPTTDPQIAITMAGDQETERFKEYLGEETKELTERIAQLEAENERLSNAWLVDEGIQQDGTLRPSLGATLRRLEKLEVENRNLRHIKGLIEEFEGVLESTGSMLAHVTAELEGDDDPGAEFEAWTFPVDRRKASNAEETDG